MTQRLVIPGHGNQFVSTEPMKKINGTLHLRLVSRDSHNSPRCICRARQLTMTDPILLSSVCMFT